MERTIITNLKVESLTQEALVDLFSTATYGNSNFDVKYPVEYYKEHLKDEEDCWEDKIAKCLLAGQSITVYDMQSEDEDEFYGNLPHKWNGSVMEYTVTLQDIIAGLEKAANSNEGYKRRAANNLIFEEDYDMEDADILLQIITYGDYIYG